MRQGNSNRLEAKTTVKVDPRMVLSSQILQLGNQDLEQAIETEINENPALERLEEEFEPLREEQILRSVAPQELRFASDDHEFRRSLPQDGTATDWMDFAAASPSLHDHLRAQLIPMLPVDLRLVGQYAVECVNEKGYLSMPIEEIALGSGSSIDEAANAVAALKECEPAGVGAFDLKECLLLQLRNAESPEERLARAIVKSHMDDFIARRVNRIMRRYHVRQDLVEMAFRVILGLNPYPGEAFAASSHAGARMRSMGVTPDLVLTREEGGWQVVVPGPEPSSLCIDRGYRKRLEELSAMERPPKDEKRHIGAYVQRAEDFIHSIQQRRKTLVRIGEYLVRHQSGFVATGSYQFLRPLTRSQMASDLGAHESTISRATMDKFVQIGNGEIVSFDVFFKPSLRVQKMIEEILQTENPAAPLSDERIARMLAEKGVVVARRTVNKYRDRTKLLSSRKRRTA